MPQSLRLGRSPVTVAPLGAGCWAWGDREFWQYERTHGPRDVIAAFTAAVDAGVTLFDTAESYGWGKSEQILGALVRRSARPVVIATKYAPLAGRGGAAAIARGLAGSLRRLRVAAIDLYQLHWADADELPIPAAMDALAAAVQAGQIRAVGVSNFRAAEMRAAHAALARHGVPLATNQVRYSLLHRAPEVDGVRDACRELGVTLLAYSPLAQGLLAGGYGPDAVPDDFRAGSAAFDPAQLAAAAPLLDAVRAIAAAHAVAPAAVALAWLLAQPDVVPLAGAKTGPQSAANARALTLQLTADELAQLDRLSQPWRVAD